MQKQDAIELAKVNAAPWAAFLTTGVFNWHLDDWVKLATIGAMLVSIIYTLAKFYYLIKRGKALDTVRGDE